MNSRGPVVVPPSGFIGVLGVGSAVHPNRNWTLHKAVSELIPRQSVEKSGRYSKVNAKAPFGGPAGEKIVTHGRSYPINLELRKHDVGLCAIGSQDCGVTV
jgi:hypothetical protein